MTQHVKRFAVSALLVGLATGGMGSVSAFASTPDVFFVSVNSAQPPTPAYDPCPAGYRGAIVGYDQDNTTGKRVYACTKI
jgi:hypothetical protein